MQVKSWECFLAKGMLAVLLVLLQALNCAERASVYRNTNKS